MKNCIGTWTLPEAAVKTRQTSGTQEHIQSAEELRQQFRSIQRTATGKQAPPVNLQQLQTELEKYQQWATSNQQIVESAFSSEAGAGLRAARALSNWDNENMSREQLHQLVDTLPEAALEPAEKALQHFQMWPPQQPPEIERMHREHQERMRRGMRPGTGGTGGGGGSYSTGSGGRIEDGHFSFSRPEAGVNVIETHHFHKGHEITVTERLRMDDDGKALFYSTEIVGPKGKRQGQEITFEVG